MTPEQELAQLRAENAKLKAQATEGLKLKVAPKGGIMLLGLRSFPVTFYVGEWTQLLAMKDKILEFAKANVAEIESNEKNPKESKNQFRAVG